MGGEASSRGPSVRLRRPSGELSLSLEEFEDRVRQGAVDPQTPVRFPLVTGERWVPAAELEIFQGLYSPERIVFARDFNLRRLPALTLGLVALNVAVYIAIGLARRSFGDDAPLVLGAKAAPLIEEAGQTWRIFAASFVHADWLHLSANICCLVLVGAALESVYSRRSYLVVVVASSLASGVASYLLTEAPSAGASGIVFGLVGGLVVFGIKYRASIPRRYAAYFGSSLVPFLVVAFAAGLTHPLIDNWAHLGGLSGGALASLPLRAEVLERRRVSARAWASSLAGLGVCIALVTILGPTLTRDALEMTVFSDDLGLQVSHPARWVRRGYDLHGNVVLAHRSYFYTSMVVGSVDRGEPIGADRAMTRAMHREIDEPEADADIDRVRVLRRGRGPLAGHDARVVAYGFEREGRSFYRELYVVVSGRREHLLALETLAVWREAYAPTFRRVVQSLRVRDQAGARRARHSPLDRATRVFGPRWEERRATGRG